MTNIFFYGSLMYPQVLNQLIGQNNYKRQEAVLNNHSRKQVKDKVYPGVQQKQGEKVQGIIYYQINQVHKNILHHFESLEYEAKQVIVQTKTGQSKAIVYIYIDQSKLEDFQWKQKEFEDIHRHRFAKDHLETKQQYQPHKKYIQEK